MMQPQDITFNRLADQYRAALTGDVLPFWMKHSPDWEHGGYFTCLDRVGKVYDTDKFMWLQCRQVWTFSKMAQVLDSPSQYVDMARLGYDFIKQNGLAPDRTFYFSLDREGRPLIHPYNIFSDCFAAMACANYARVSGSSEAGQLAVDTLGQILKRQEHPKGKWEKSTGNRPMKGFALPMILSNLVLEMDFLLDDALIDHTLDRCVAEVMQAFWDPQTGWIYEYIDPAGGHPDTFEGRLVNPGHGIEAMWFIMDIADRRKDHALFSQCVDILLVLLEKGWDPTYEGIFYFLDAQGKPPLQLEWDQKLWWVHLEALVALLTAYRSTRRQDVWEWYQKVHAYTWGHFPDPVYGEWWGYLNRQGAPLIPLKGGKWKGCFHVPRALMRCSQELENMYNG